ncbi:hypothetical protein F511_37085 [Dorcoceras hygrometricum]|uniref:Uncharacterized protein n=1 Tax=Dorcoceras hygrometricum TaxID=472368 RepID=A0A2Z7CPS6_9LAMI|nr:hypothetical protein F511_37085 [Dorcoceras hygrometricum]
MPQANIETLVTAWTGGGNERKISCETLADTAADVEASDYAADATPESPSGSFWLSKDAEYDWFDRNAFYERKESTNGYAKNSNPNPNINPSPNSSSQKLPAKFMAKASILRLPKTQNAAFVDTKRRTCKPVNVRLFPKRFASSGKSSPSFAEPGSPKVSCMGRVRSKRFRRRLDSLRRGEKPGLRKPERSGSGKVMEAVEEEPPYSAESEPHHKSMSVKVEERFDGEIVAEPPGLGGMKRFSSGRRPDIGQPSF